MMGFPVLVGIDVSAQTLSVSINQLPAFEVAQTRVGYTALVRRLRATAEKPSDILCVMEATGTYFMQPATALHEAGFAVSVINPVRTHYFARMLLQQAKTDCLDAQLLAAYGQHFPLSLWSPPPLIYEALHQRLVQRDNLIGIRTELACQDHARQHRCESIASIKERSGALFELLKEQVHQLDDEITNLLNTESEWHENAQLLLSIPCVGPITAAWLLVATRNFAQVESGEQLASFAGLVPHRQQSGSSLSSFHRVRYAGHKRLRKALYLATLNAARFNPAIAPFYKRLREKGKPTKVARIACARKLAQIAFAVVRDKHPFDANF